jgi:prefoldin subunit 5
MDDILGSVLNFLQELKAEMSEFKEQMAEKLDRLEDKMDSLEKNAVSPERIRVVERQMLAIGVELREDVRAVNQNMDNFNLEILEVKTDHARLKLELNQLNNKLAGIEDFSQKIF